MASNDPLSPQLRAASQIDGASDAHRASKNGKIETLEAISREEPAMLTIPDKNGRLPCHYAVQAGAIESLKWFFRQPGFWNADYAGLLQLSIELQRLDSFKFLWEWFPQNRLPPDVLQHSVQRAGVFNSLVQLSRIEFFNWLWEHEGRLVMDQECSTSIPVGEKKIAVVCPNVLFLACQMGKLDLLHFFLAKCGPELDPFKVVDHVWGTLAHVCCFGGHHSCLKLLWSVCPDIFRLPLPCPPSDLVKTLGGETYHQFVCKLYRMVEKIQEDASLLDGIFRNFLLLSDHGVPARGTLEMCLGYLQKRPEIRFSAAVGGVLPSVLLSESNEHIFNFLRHLGFGRVSFQHWPVERTCECLSLLGRQPQIVLVEFDGVCFSNISQFRSLIELAFSVAPFLTVSFRGVYGWKEEYFPVFFDALCRARHVIPKLHDLPLRLRLLRHACLWYLSRESSEASECRIFRDIERSVGGDPTISMLFAEKDCPLPRILLGKGDAEIFNFLVSLKQHRCLALNDISCQSIIASIAYFRKFAIERVQVSKVDILDRSAFTELVLFLLEFEHVTFSQCKFWDARSLDDLRLLMLQSPSCASVNFSDTVMEVQWLTLLIDEAVARGGGACLSLLRRIAEKSDLKLRSLAGGGRKSL